MKKHVWRTHNRMVFESDLKTFNDQCDIITTGNVIGGVQKSSYIRPHSEVMNGGYEGKPGQFRAFDLNQFPDLPWAVRNWMAENREKHVILYEFRFWRGREKQVIGYIITDDKHRLIRRFHNGYSLKRMSALMEAEKYVTEADENGVTIKADAA